MERMYSIKKIVSGVPLVNTEHLEVEVIISPKSQMLEEEGEAGGLERKQATLVY